MEHRYSRRVDIGIKALVFRRGIPITLGVIRNASHGGLFIEMNIDEVRVNQPIEIEFRLQSGGRSSRARVKTVVARVADDGIGLELAENDDKGYEALCALVDGFAMRERLRDVSVVGL